MVKPADARETVADVFGRCKWLPVDGPSAEMECPCSCDFDPVLCLDWLCQQHVFFVESNGRIVKDEADKYHVHSSSIASGPPWSAQLRVFDIDAQHDIFVFFRLRAT